VTSGAELLVRARVMSDADVALVFGHGGSRDADEVERAALVAALLSSFTAADAPLIRELTRQEIAAVRDADSGCGDVLLACCWLLFMLGHVEDTALVWQAKNVNFDTHCYIDSVFLVPQGAAVTAEFARFQGLTDLVDWVEGEWTSDTKNAAQEWRSGSSFAQVPSSEASVEELATWMQQ
jgi:hypothetical protein